MTMDSEVYEVIPKAARDIFSKVEKYTGIEIAVSKTPDERVKEIPEAKEGTVGIVMGPKSIVFEYPKTIDDILPADWIHEAAHLERVYLQHTPSLYPKDMTNGAAAASIDNWLEHVVIYERQLELLPEYRVSLHQEIERFWEQIDRDGRSSYELDFNLLTRYLITRKYGGKKSREIMTAAFARLRYTKLQAIGPRIEEIVQDKIELCRRTLQFCGLPTKIFWVRRYRRGADRFEFATL